MVHPVWLIAGAYGAEKSGTFSAAGHAHCRLWWPDGVAVITDGDSMIADVGLRAAHELLFAVEMPDLVVADRGFAAGAIRAGIDKMDLDPAGRLAIAFTWAGDPEFSRLEAAGKAIIAGLEAIRADIDAGNFAFRADREDIHLNIEAALAERIGPAAGRLHTARSAHDIPAQPNHPHCAYTSTRARNSTAHQLRWVVRTVDSLRWR